ncbi:semaphorin-4A [Tiliqua scincoides]|uniref:semaphorin-4A n=1 Tax=Tiliqua scincoides TaxID=71010 RepID=UPI0034626657
MNTHWSPCLLVGLLGFAASLAADVLPRITFHVGDPRRPVTLFQEEGVLHFDTFLPSADGKTLYVGARDTVLALGIDDAGSLELKGKILWRPTASKTDACVFKKKSNETECFNFIRVLVQLNETHLYTCGTYAFSPTCAYINLETFSLVKNEEGTPLLHEGKGISPFDPQHRSAAVVVDGELYTGTMSNFLGNEPVVSRTLGSRTSLKTDTYLNWLRSDASFVASFNVPSPPDNEKVYFFFAETAKEFDFFERLTVSRVGRVCKNDVGGDKVLQKKWTTFLKAQISCSQQGLFPHTVVQDVFALPQAQGGGTIFYGVFASQWQTGNSGSSAVCSFSLDSIKDAFDGKYKEFNKDCSHWMTYSGPTLSPRPGSCSVGSSSDKILTFMKEHFLMDEKILPTDNQPLLVKEDVKYTRIAVHQTLGVSGALYCVMFLGTDGGALHKAVVVGRGAHIIEAIPLFEGAEPVRNLLLSPEKEVLYVGYSRGVLRVPMANCSLYATCAQCVLARDPYCAWDRGTHQCRDVRIDTEDVGGWLQDIETGNPNAKCQPGGGKARSSTRSSNDSDSSLVTTLTPALNSVVRLTCLQASDLANYTWTYPSSRIPAKLVMEDGNILVVVVQRATLGTYECRASENGYLQTVARYRVLSPHYPGLGSDSGTAEEGQAVPVSEQRSYWVQFVTVTVLLSMTLAVVAAMAAFSYRGRLKAKSKVQGCSTPEASKMAGQEKVPLNGSQSPPQSRTGQQGQSPCPAAAKACCVQVEEALQDTDVDNNRLGSGLANREDSKGAVAAVEGV